MHTESFEPSRRIMLSDVDALGSRCRRRRPRSSHAATRRIRRSVGGSGRRFSAASRSRARPLRHFDAQAAPCPSRIGARGPSATMCPSMAFASIPDILEDLRAGRMIVLVDDERPRERRRLRHRGRVRHAGDRQLPHPHRRLATSAWRSMEPTCERLELGPQGAINTSLRQTPFTISVDGHPRHGVGTGISSSDRATTIRMMADPDHPRPTTSSDRATSTRSAPDPVASWFEPGRPRDPWTSAGSPDSSPAAAIIEVVKPDGDMARLPDLEVMCEEHGTQDVLGRADHPASPRPVRRWSSGSHPSKGREHRDAGGRLQN